MRRRKENIFAEITNDTEWNIYEIFHENTKLNKLNSREYGTFIELVTGYPYFLKRMAQSYKLYPGYRQIKLPRKFVSSKKIIEEIMQKRRTVRKFNGQCIDINELAKILYYSYGISSKVSVPKSKGIIQYLRVTPSAGALYPLEIYVNILSCKNLKPGLYHYNVLHHSLEQLKLGNFKQYLTNSCMIDHMLERANLLVFIAGIFKRTTFKYHERGYRFVLMESGHVAQNLSLICEAMGLGSVLIGGFKDDELNNFLNIDGVNEAVLYPVIIGKV
jgi:SagB-type dehydrogenase family enzyme